MSSIDGLITGLDTTSIIQQLLSAERIPQNQLQVQQATAEAKADVFADLRGRYDAVRTAAQALDLPDDWSALDATSTSELVTATPGNGEITGAVSFRVLQRASAHQVYSTDTLSSLDDVVAAGGTGVFSARDFSPLGFSELAGAGLAVGEQTFEVTQQSNAAVKPGDTALADGVVITGANDTFAITVNGTAHALTIEQGTYETADDLVAAVRDSIDNVVGLSDDLTVTNNPLGQLEFISVREGSAASVQLTAGTALTDLGMSVDLTANVGVDGVVSVNGTDTTITNTDAGTDVILNAGTGTVTATLSGGIRLGTADVEQVSFGNGTLSEVVNAINGAGGSGTKAAIIQVGEGEYRLQLSASETGSSSAIDLDLAQFTGLSGFTTLSNGQDAEVEIEGLNPYSVTSSTDTFNDLIPGVDVTLAGLPTDSVTIDVTRATDALAERVETLVTAINDVVKSLSAASAYDAEEDQASLLTGNSTIRRALDEITRAVINPVGGAALGSVGLTGISIEDDGTFEFDKDVFLQAYNDDPQAVERVYSVPFGSEDESAIGRILDEIDDATAFGTGYLRSAEDAEKARVEDLNESIGRWDQRLEIRERVLRATYTRLETALAQLQSQSTWLAGQIGSLSTP